MLILHKPVSSVKLGRDRIKQEIGSMARAKLSPPLFEDRRLPMREALSERVLNKMQAVMTNEAAAAAAEATASEGVFHFTTPQHCVEVEDQSEHWSFCQHLRELPKDSRVLDYWIQQRHRNRGLDDNAPVFDYSDLKNFAHNDPRCLTTGDYYEAYGLCTYTMIHDLSSYVIYGSLVAGGSRCLHKRRDVLLASSLEDLHMVETLVSLTARQAPLRPAIYFTKRLAVLKIGDRAFVPKPGA